MPDAVMLDKSSTTLRLDDVDAFVDLLQPVYRKGQLVQPVAPLHDIRERAMQATALFYETHGDADYPVALEKKVQEFKRELIKRFRND